MSDTTTSPACPDPDQLLRELDWLRRLARGLVHDPAAADDVAQQTALAALRHPPSGARRPWLARVARNFVRQDRRAAGRRSRYEGRATAGAPPADASDLAAQAEIHRLLARLVTALPEAQRDVIVLRYHHDLAPKEIAERLRIPAGTVRARLHRALARLRERLDERHRGDRRAWIAALLPLAGEGDVPTVPGGRAPWMAAAACAVGCVVAILLALDPAAPTDAAAGSTKPHSEAAPVTGVADVATEDDVAPPLDEPAPAIRGTVRDDSGRPVAGARVALSRALDTEVTSVSGLAGLVGVLERRATALRSATTDPEGTFVFDDVAPGTWTLQARHAAGCSPATEIEARTLDPVELRLDHPAAITGDVLDAAGRPVADARVAFLSPQTERQMLDVARTDARGRFVLAATDDPGQYRRRGILADHDAYAPAVVTYARSDRFVRVVLARGAVLTGRVLDAEGTTVAGAAVRATPFPRSDGYPPRAADVASRTDTAGRFELPRFGENERDKVQVVVTADGKGAVVHQTSFPRDAPLELRLPASAPTRLVALTSDGRPVPGVAIAVRGSISAEGSWLGALATNAPAFFERTIVTSAKGEIEVSTPVGTRAQFRCASEDERYLLHGRSRYVQTEAGGRVELKLVPRGEDTDESGTDAVPIEVSGRVVDASGAPLAGAQVTVWREARGSRPPDPTWTDAGGNWKAAVDGGGTCHAQAFLPGHLGRSARLTVSETVREFEQIQLLPAVRIEGRVVGRDDAPVPRAYVGAHADECESVFTWTDADGRFAFDGFPPDATVSVHRAPGHMPAYRKEPVGTSGQVEIRLEPASRIAGRVTTGDGAPVEACVLVAVTAANSGQRQRHVQSFTDGNGGFDISPLPPGTWDLHLMMGSQEAVRRGVESGTTGIAWVLPSRAALSGRIVDENDRPVVAAQVWVARDDGADGAGSPPLGVAITDAGGAFRGEVEDVGTYAVWIDHPTLTTPVLRSIAPGAADLMLRMTDGSRLRGRVLHPDGGPAEAFVQLTPVDRLGPTRQRVHVAADDGMLDIPAPADVPFRVTVIASYADTTLRQGPVDYGTLRAGDPPLEITLKRRE